MKLTPVSQTNHPNAAPTAASPDSAPPREAFDPMLQAFLRSNAGASVGVGGPVAAGPSADVTGMSPSPVVTLANPSPTIDTHKAMAAYRQQAARQTAAAAPGTAAANSSQHLSGYQIYKDDQLLRNPGGDHYDLERKTVAPDPPHRKSFLSRIGKDLTDAFGNVKNMVSNFLFGAKFCYRDESNEIRQGTRRGLIGSVVDFFKDLGSAFSFGRWRPDGGPQPKGFLEHLGHFVSHVKKAFSKDLFDGIGGSVNHMAGNLVLAGWNLVQVAPDAILGNVEAGRKLTTTIFDNGQVMVEYLTDILPGGDAWLRVHAPSIKERKFPIVYNLGMPEHFKGDVRWEYIRNTPFRKSIETVGSLLADVAAALSIGSVRLFSDDAPKRALP